MEQSKHVMEKLQSGQYSERLSFLYPGEGTIASQQKRYCAAVQEFEKLFGADREIGLYSAPGRTEIAGNHTDHQHGCVVGASVDMDMIAVASPSGTNTVRIQSEGYSMLEVDLDDLTVHENQKNTSISLIRGVAAGFKNRGYRIGGFDAYCTSDVLKGSGLSSSAAYEVLLGTLFSYLFNDGTVDPVTVAQIGQYAENVYFGKPSGLLDQMSCSVGGYVAIDFYNPEKPVIEKIEFDFASCGYTLCIVDTGGNHADLTHEYAAVTEEMKSVSAFFGKEFLRDVPADDFYSRVGELKGKVSDRAILRAHHFYSDNIRAQEIAQALREKDFERFKALSTASGRSSFQYLQNVYPSSSAPQEQGLSVALAMSERLLGTKGAYRVHGGGFGGTIQVFVPNDMAAEYKSQIERITGKDTCHLLSIRPVGGTAITEG